MTEFEILSQLKRVEMKFQEIVEMRKVYNFFEPKKLRTVEYVIKQEGNEVKTKNNVIQADEAIKRKNANVQKSIDAK